MPFERSEMLYDDGYYKWAARADHDNPYYRQGTDYSEISKTEGYEVLYFLNHIAKTYWNPEPTNETYQHMEWLLRYHVPARSTHKQAANFIISNWNNF